MLPGVTLPASLAGLLGALRPCFTAPSFPGRAIHVVADAACHGPALKHLPPAVTWTCRLRANAVLYDLAPPRTPRTMGRPRRKGARLGTPGQLAAAARWAPATVRIYRRDQHIRLAGITCLWYGCLDTRTGITARRRAQPWYPAKTEPAFEDMLIQLRRVLITARISKGSAAHPTPEQTKDVLAAWHAAAA